MHETGLCEGLLELVERQAAGRPVAEVRLRVGMRHAVVEEAFRQAFQLAATGTVADGAALDLVVTPASLGCRRCGRRAWAVDPLAACPECGAGDVDLRGGDELVLESLRYRVGGEVGTGVSRHPR